MVREAAVTRRYCCGRCWALDERGGRPFRPCTVARAGLVGGVGGFGVCKPSGPDAPRAGRFRDQHLLADTGPAGHLLSAAQGLGISWRRPSPPWPKSLFWTRCIRLTNRRRTTPVPWRRCDSRCCGYATHRAGVGGRAWRAQIDRPPRHRQRLFAAAALCTGWATATCWSRCRRRNWPPSNCGFSSAALLRSLPGCWSGA
jgi:hypothetical protein